VNARNRRADYNSGATLCVRALHPLKSQSGLILRSRKEPTRDHV
jgi:hypothetical protein